MRVQADGSLSFGTPRTEAVMRERLKVHVGKYIDCTLDMRESSAKRRFFEGPVTWYWFYQNPQSKWATFNEARENIKLQWNGRNSYDQHGNAQRHARTTRMSDKRFSDMLLRMQTDWIDEGYEWPDAADYEAWVMTDPPIDAEYPPLKRLKAKYERTAVWT